MAGSKLTVCIAGKNQCAIDVLNYLISNYKNKVNLLALPNKNDNSKLVNESKSTLPNDNIDQDNKDLDDEIPF